MKIAGGLGDEGWNQLTAVLNFGVFNGPKRIQAQHRLFLDLGADKISTNQYKPVGKAAEF